MSYCGYLMEKYFGISESRSVAKYGVVFSKSTGDPRHSGKGFCGLKDRGDASIDAKADARSAADHGFTKKGDMGQGRYLRAQLGKSSRAKDDLKLMAEMSDDTKRNAAGAVVVKSYNARNKAKAKAAIKPLDFPTKATANMKNAIRSQYAKDSADVAGQKVKDKYPLLMKWNKEDMHKRYGSD